MWGAILSAVLGAVQLGVGASQKSKAKKAAKDNVMQPYEISPLYGDTLGVAQQEANFGFSPATLNAFTQTSQQNLAASSENILRGGGDVNDIAKLYGVDNNARKNLAFENDKLRASKLQNLFEQSAQMAGQQAIAWRLNYFDRWKDRAVAAASMLQGGNAMMSSGFNTLGNAAGQFAKLSTVQSTPNGNSGNNLGMNQQQMPTFYNNSFAPQVASPEFVNNGDNAMNIQPTNFSTYFNQNLNTF